MTGQDPIPQDDDALIEALKAAVDEAGGVAAVIGFDPRAATGDEPEGAA